MDDKPVKFRFWVDGWVEMMKGKRIKNDKYVYFLRK